jgi:hypothetical protein
MLYNGLGETLNNVSYAKLLKYMSYVHNSTRNAGGVCHTCKYVIEIKERFIPHNLRTYIWEGDPIPLQIPDANFEGDGDPPMIDNPDPNAGQTWCFEYGEEEWIEHTVNGDGSVSYGPSFTATLTAARGDYLAVPAVPAVGRINCNTGVEM